MGIRLHRDVTYACVEGPRLGTRAESLFMRQVGCQLVGMTNVPEVFLAREAQICYATVCIATDYDCWMDDPAMHVSVSAILAKYRASLDRARALLDALLAGAAARGRAGDPQRAAVCDADAGRGARATRSASGWRCCALRPGRCAHNAAVRPSAARRLGRRAGRAERDCCATAASPTRASSACASTARTGSSRTSPRAPSSCAIRVGRFLLGREVRALRRLRGHRRHPVAGLSRRCLRHGGALRAGAHAGAACRGGAGEHRLPGGAGGVAAAGARARPGAPGHARRRQPADDARRRARHHRLPGRAVHALDAGARCAAGSRTWT